MRTASAVIVRVLDDSARLPSSAARHGVIWIFPSNAPEAKCTSPHAQRIRTDEKLHTAETTFKFARYRGGGIEKSTRMDLRPRHGETMAQGSDPIHFIGMRRVVSGDAICVGFACSRLFLVELFTVLFASTVVTAQCPAHGPINADKSDSDDAADHYDTTASRTGSRRGRDVR